MVAGLSPGESDHSLAGGQAGFALLFGALAAAGGVPGVPAGEAAAMARAQLDRAVETVAGEETGTSLWGGFPGVAFAAELVDGWIEGKGDDRSEAIDEVLAAVLSRRSHWPAAHDLVTGLTGVGVYALSRRPAPTAIRCLELVIGRLAEAVQTDGHGAWWPTPPELIDPEFRGEFRSGWVDLGMAHGAAGAIAMLGGAVAAGVGGSQAVRLLDGAVRWLLAHAHAGADGPTFPNWVAAGWEPRPARTAWCYGDPGVAVALLLAGRGAGRADWEREGLALALRAAARPAGDTGAAGSGLCHGAAGLAHLYHRLHRLTGHPDLAVAATAWLERTLEACEEHARPGRPGWEEIDVADGAAGVGLALLAAASHVEPTWDRLFLLSVPHLPAP